MRVPRITVRRVMVVVAIIAIGIGTCREAVRLYQRHRGYANAAWIHGQLARQAAEQAKVDPEAWWAYFRATEEQLERSGQENVRDGTLVIYSSPPADQAEVARYHARMEAKYRRAARRPWFRVEPDPPAPRWTWDGRYPD